MVNTSSMVLSNKKLKQNRRAELPQHLAPTTKSIKAVPISKHEKKRQRLNKGRKSVPAEAVGLPLEDEAGTLINHDGGAVIHPDEMDTYNRCIQRLLTEDVEDVPFKEKSDQSPELNHLKRNDLSNNAYTGMSDVLNLDTANAASHDAVKTFVADAKSNKRKKIGDAHIGISNDTANATSHDVTKTLVADAKSKKQKERDESKQSMEQQEHITGDQRVEGQESSVSRTVYVGGIPYYSSEDDIRVFFGDCGTIAEVNLKTFSDSRKFRGIALLTFKTLGGAERALALNGANMGERFLKIKPAASSQPTEAVTKELHDAPPRKIEGYTRAYIGNLSWDVTEQDIKGFFKDCKIHSICFSQHKETGDFQGFGHVDFEDDRSLELALALDQKTLVGRPVKVAYAVPLKARTKDEVRKGPRDKSSPKDKKSMTCFSCGEKGHVASRCVTAEKRPLVLK